MRATRSRWLLPVIIATAVVAVVAVVVVAVSAGRGGKNPSRPPVLHLTSVATGTLGLPAHATGGGPDKSGTASSNPSGSGWRLDGTLPDGPSSARVHLLPAGAATGAFVSALARALGRSGEPQHLNGGWYLVSGTTELSVSELAGRHWTYSNHGCLAGPVLDPQTGTACAIATPAPPPPMPPTPSGAPAGNGVNPAPTPSPPVQVVEPPPVPEKVARNIARPVLESVGVNPDTARVETAGGQRSVVVSPEVAGATIFGLETRVAVDEHGQIVDASGWLATPTAGATYPLITALQGYQQLLQQPQPLSQLGMPCQIVPGTPGCAPTPVRVVTGATLGLTAAYGTGRSILLVPAWLFQVRNDSTPIAVVAVERAFLGEPEQPSPGGQPTTGSEPGSAGSGSGTSGGTATTRVPTSDEQGGPATAPTPTPVR